MLRRQEIPRGAKKEEVVLFHAGRPLSDPNIGSGKKVEAGGKIPPIIIPPLPSPFHLHSLFVPVSSNFDASKRNRRGKVKKKEEEEEKKHLRWMIQRSQEGKEKGTCSQDVS